MLHTIAQVLQLIMSNVDFHIAHDSMGLCVNPTRSGYPDAFKQSAMFPFLDNSETVLACVEVISISAVLYWKPLAGIIRNRPGAVEESKGLPQVQVKIVFPPTFPSKSKTFKLDYDLTVHQAVLDIAAAMRFQASLVSMIGLRIPEKLLAAPAVLQLVELMGLRSEASFPFLESSKTLRHYRKLLVSIDHLEYQYASSQDAADDDNVGGGGGSAAAVELALAPEGRVLDPIMWKTPERAGWIMRQGKVLSWKHYYALLQHDMLFLFASSPSDDPEQLPLDSVALAGITAVVVKKENTSRKSGARGSSASPGASLASTPKSPRAGGEMGRKSPREFFTSTISSIGSMPFVLKLTERWSGGGSRSVLLACESEEEASEWEKAVRRGSEKRAGPLNVRKNLDFSHEADLRLIINTDNPLDMYSNFTSIGKGGFSSVWTALTRATGELVVVKVIKIKKLNLKYILQELMMHKTCVHPNIVSFIDAYFVPTKKEIWVVLEFMDGGNLTSKLDPTNGMSEEAIRFATREMVNVSALLWGVSRGLSLTAHAGAALHPWHEPHPSRPQVRQCAVQ